MILNKYSLLNVTGDENKEEVGWTYRMHSRNQKCPKNLDEMPYRNRQFGWSRRR